jgi:predicted DNA-binding protein YlxM (UPF0122 family)
MARRSDIDWEMVQRLYVAGQLSIREIAKKCGINPSSITENAKKNGWTRNLAGAIKELTKAKIAQIDVQDLVDQSIHESVQKSAQTIQKAIESASDVQAGVIVRHRNEIRKLSEQASRLDELINAMLDATSPTRQEANESGEQVVVLNVTDVLKITQAHKNAVDSRSKIFDKERQAYGIEDGGDDTADDGPTEIVVNLIGGDGES